MLGNKHCLNIVKYLGDMGISQSYDIPLKKKRIALICNPFLVI